MLVGGLALAIIAPALVLLNLKLAHGSAGAVNMQGLLGGLFVAGVVSLMLNLAWMAGRSVLGWLRRA
jgi:hypothetical protein